MSRLLALTTTLALAIACLGLFGLAYFTANLKRKEIGIRRVLGATSGSVVALLSGRFAKLDVLQRGHAQRQPGGGLQWSTVQIQAK